ncbi:MULTISPECIES: hypothetical protein [unclassified Microcoleus]|uniref:hypothetical protein n=1 Tax=unclassified Microcoleus TaxID=2642155 RepID=UPI002FD78306
MTENSTMYSLMQCVLLSTLLASAIAVPQKPDRSSISENQLTASQQMLLAKKSGSKPEGCSSSPTPGCSRRDRVTDM